MRILWTSDQISRIAKLQSLLQAKNISCHQDEAIDTDWGSSNYGGKMSRLWVIEENDVVHAKEILKEFLESSASETHEEIASQHPPINFTQPEYKAPRIIVKGKKLHFFLTNGIIILCALLLLATDLSVKQEPIPASIEPILITVSPVQKALLYDYPEHYELLDDIIQLYGYSALEKPHKLPAPGKLMFNEFLRTPAWNGIYGTLVERGQQYLTNTPAPPPQAVEPKLFEKISQGELWRLVTPALLHANFFHLLFNMLWLLALGTQMEARIGPWRLLSFILITAAFSNTCQYLMSGPVFLGFSGVDCAMIFFIRARQKKAPWEGYQLINSTFYFILAFIGGLVLVSGIAFVLQVMGQPSPPLGIANTAHTAGALSGYFLGRLQSFAWKG